MEPSESQTILCGEISTHHIEGISDGFVPGIFARHSELVDSTLSVSSEEAIAEMRQLARGHGLLCGPSSGAHLIAARRVREQHPEFDTVVTLFCDEGEKSLTDHFSKPHGDLARTAFTQRAIPLPPPLTPPPPTHPTTR